MTRQIGNPGAVPRHANSTDVFVIFSVTVLSLATGAWLLSQLGVAIWWAMIGALAIYATLLSLHLAARRSFTALDRAAAARAEAEIDWLHGPHDDHLEDASPAMPERNLPGDWDIAPTPAAARSDGFRAEARAELAHELPESHTNQPFDFRPLRGPAMELPTPDLAAQRTGAPEPQLRAADPRAREPRFDDGSATEMNVEIIQDLIKKLADELNGPNPPEHASEPDSELASEADTQAMIGRSVAALETTARTMRAPAAPQESYAPTGSVPAWWPTAEDGEPEPQAAAPTNRPPALNPQLARIAEAVAAERIEVLLEPIQALAEGRTRHFEVSVRLLTADGATLEQCDFARAAQGSGLMPRIDAERMIRAARVARRLGERGRQGSVLSVIAGESLTDAEFLGTAASHNGAGRMTLVLSFAQSEVRTFTQGHAEALGRLAAAGYSFALEEVVDLDMDFGALKAMGFEFVKLDAPVFLEGLAAPGGRIPASDICRHLSDFGLTLIVGRIEDEWTQARILGFGVVFGKGTLFGGPKLVKHEVVATPAAAA